MQEVMGVKEDFKLNAVVDRVPVQGVEDGGDTTSSRPGSRWCEQPMKGSFQGSQ